MENNYEQKAPNPNPKGVEGWKWAQNTHSPSFLVRPKSLVNPSILQHINIVVDLIDHENSSWKVSLVRQLYDKEDGDKILSIPISNMTYENIPDKIIWPIAQNDEYGTPKTYEILLNSIK